MKKILCFLLSGLLLIGFPSILGACTTPEDLQQSEELTDAKGWFPTDHETVLSLTVATYPENVGYSRSYTTEGKKQVFVDYFNSLELNQNSSQDPGQLNGITYEIAFQNVDGSTTRFYRLGNFLRESDGVWMEMSTEQSEQFDALIQTHLSDVDGPFQATVSTKHREFEIPSYYMGGYHLTQKGDWMHTSGSGTGSLFRSEEKMNALPILSEDEILSIHLPADASITYFKVMAKADGAVQEVCSGKIWDEVKDLATGVWYVVLGVTLQGEYSVKDDRHGRSSFQCVFQYVVE
ncbi:MAG: hypothetical protein E7629_00440 [Ruminococcaceae bacterium]|nr:hypothetical protein [Oscillospiraceae bacterium]